MRMAMELCLLSWLCLLPHHILGAQTVSAAGAADTQRPNETPRATLMIAPLFLEDGTFTSTLTLVSDAARTIP